MITKETDDGPMLPQLQQTLKRMAICTTANRITIVKYAHDNSSRIGPKFGFPRPKEGG